jgi:hypothetical protein
MAPDYLSLWRWIGSNAIGRIGKMPINPMVSRQQVGSEGEVPVHCHHSLPFGSSLRLSNYRRRVESAPRLPSELR